MLKLGFAYTREYLLDKLEEHLGSALHHHYLMVQLNQTKQRYLRVHWNNEAETYLKLAVRAFGHTATISNKAKLKCLDAIKQRMLPRDKKARQDAKVHFKAVFPKEKQTDITDADRDEFWAKADAALREELLSVDTH